MFVQDHALASAAVATPRGCNPGGASLDEPAMLDPEHSLDGEADSTDRESELDVTITFEGRTRRTDAELMRALAERVDDRDDARANACVRRVSERRDPCAGPTPIRLQLLRCQSWVRPDSGNELVRRRSRVAARCCRCRRRTRKDHNRREDCYERDRTERSTKSSHMPSRMS